MRAAAAVALLLLVASSRSARSQQPAAPQDSQPDTLDRGPCWPHGPACALVLLGAAPPFILLFDDRGAVWNEPGMTRSTNHVWAYFTGGGLLNSSREGWAYAQTVEALWNGVFGELRVESFDLPPHVRFATARGGYLAHPKPGVATGVVLGYRRARGDTVQNALEIGLPLFVAGPGGIVRFEPAYVISSRGVTWNYRVQANIPIARTPLSVGFVYELKPLRQHGPYFHVIDVLLGLNVK